jgi:Right handed beta helix region
MRFHADDFGCVADGRYLQAVSIGGGSAILTVPAGTVVGTEVGKQIAIPGAVDLVATVAELVGSKTVLNASIEVGSTRLLIVLVDNEQPFPGQAHVGFRVTVEGAGPGGITLLTDVVGVEDGGLTLVLALPAATTVHGVRAVVNDPGLVLLSNHARATVGPVPVDLGNREVSDAAMIVGDRLLRSETAAFSSLDLLKTVTIGGAGHLATTITAAIDDVTVQLAAPAQRPVTDGPADVWKTDSGPGVRDLLDAVRASGAEFAEIIFGPGLYDLTRSEAGLPAAVGLERFANLTIRGAGPGVTVLRLMPEQPLFADNGRTVLDTHIAMARDCHKLTIRDLTLYGAYLTMQAAAEQMHGLNINQGCRDVVVDKVEVFQSAGDGVRLLGEKNNKLSRVWLTGCRLIQNRRTGVAFQRAVDTVWIRDCYIEATPPSADACIDLEPTGDPVTAAPTDIVIDSNVLVHGTQAVAVSLSGVGGGQPARRVRFSGNNVHGGNLGGVNAQDLTIAGNTILGGSVGPGMAFRGVDGLRIEDNRIVSLGARHEGISLVRRPEGRARRIRILGNEVEADGIAITLVVDGDHVEVRGNRVFGTSASIGIRVEAAGTAVCRDIRVVDNSVANFGVAGIQLTARASDRLVGVQVTGNDLHVDVSPDPNKLIGIDLSGPDHAVGWMDRAVLTENRISDTIATKINRPVTAVPFVVAGGNPEDRAIYEGAVPPESDETPPQNNVPAPPGSLYLRIDPHGPPSVYLRTSTRSGVERWVELAKVEPDNF